MEWLDGRRAGREREATSRRWRLAARPSEAIAELVAADVEKHKRLVVVAAAAAAAVVVVVVVVDATDRWRELAWNSLDRGA